MPTKLLYLSNTDLTIAQARIEAVVSADGAVPGLVLSVTPFYPQGGGQRSDRGVIVSAEGRMDDASARFEDGKVVHRGEVTGTFSVGQVCHVAIDGDLRRLHSRLHSAGELLCAALRSLGHHWRVAGADHAPNASKITIEAKLNERERALLEASLQHELDELIAMDGQVNVFVTDDPAVVTAICGYTPDYLPPSEPVRIVVPAPGLWGRPCMGTHVDRLGTIGRVLIRGVKIRKGQTSIGYDLV